MSDDTITERVAEIADLEAQVKAHCMCARFETDGTHFRVLYPPGYYPDGVQASKGLGKAEALRRLLSAMERHWQESML